MANLAHLPDAYLLRANFCACGTSVAGAKSQNGWMATLDSYMAQLPKTPVHLNIKEQGTPA